MFLVGLSVSFCESSLISLLECFQSLFAQGIWFVSVMIVLDASWPLQLCTMDTFTFLSVLLTVNHTDQFLYYQTYLSMDLYVGSKY